MTEAATLEKPVKKSTTKPTSSKAPKSSPKAKKTSTEGKGGFAVFATGGKQYRVQEGEYLKIEKLPGELKIGDTITFDNVLLKDNGAGDITLGSPFIKGSSIVASLKSIGRNKKVIVIKYKQKSRYFKKNGHRQPHFEVLIDSIK